MAEDVERDEMEAIRRIVERMRRKYAEQGLIISPEEAEEREELLGEREISVELGKPEDLVKYPSPVVRFLGRLYLLFRAPLKAFAALIEKMPFSKTLHMDLYSSGLHLTVPQYMAIVASVATLAFFLSLPLAFFLSSISPVYPVLAVAGITFFATVGALMYPRHRAEARGREIDRELPFALRHLATEVRSGVGLYGALRAVAQGGYGALSEELAKTLREIDEGISTEDAIKNLILRTHSRGLKRAMIQILRALHTGGDLSRIIMEIASDVAFDIRMKLSEFAEKLNFMGIIFVFVAIVAPVLLSVVVSISSSPIGFGMLGLSFLSPVVVALFLLVGVPVFFLFMLFYIKSANPV